MEAMNYLFLGHLLVFGVAALLCFAAIPRARHIDHHPTREGFVAILLTCGLWALGYLGYFVLPSSEIKIASYIFGVIAALGCVGAWLYFSLAYTGRSPRQAPYRRVIAAAFLGIALVKLTNPVHHMYFTTEWVSEPFPHLALHHGVVHWLVLAISYVVIGVSFFMLFEWFYHAGTSARPLAVLVGITGLPIVLNIYGTMGASVLPIWYEPIGVAIFAIGTLYVYFDRFEAIRFTGSTNEPSIFLDQDWTIRDSNQSANAPFPNLDDGHGQPLDTVLPEVAAVAAEEDSDTIQIENGESGRYYHISTTPISAGEVVTARVITLHDVSEREQYRRLLERQNERLEQFASIVSHDLRNPLNVAEGRLELARETGEIDHLEDVEAAHDRMLKLIDDLLTLARSGENIGEVSEVELSRLVEDCWQMIDSGDATLSLRDDLTITVRADEERLRQLFENLFRNAIDHGGSEVDIEVGVMPSRQGFYVEDTGPGIPEGDQSRVLEPGFTTNEDGTGFGLAIVADIVRGHGWDISVTHGEAGGARFEIRDVETVE